MSANSFDRCGKDRMSKGMRWELAVFNEKLKTNSEIPGNNIWEWMADVDKKGCKPFLPTIFKCCGFPLLAQNTSTLLSNYYISSVVRKV